MRMGIKDWLKQHPHYMLTDKRQRRGQKVMFHWSINLPFAILHADLWLLGHFTGHNGYVAFINIMSNMIQFVIVVPVPNETAATLA